MEIRRSRRWRCGIVATASLTLVGCDGSETPTADSTAPSMVDDSTTTATTTIDADGVFTPGTSDATASQRPATTTPAIITTTTTTTTTMVATTSSSTTTTTSAPATTSAPIPTPVDESPCPPTGAAVWEVRPASGLPAPAVPDGWRTESIGTSVLGRDLTALARPAMDDVTGRTVLVVGGIHGNEPVSPPTVRAMVEATIPDDVELWLVPLLNPDGSAAGTRCNAAGVDLNRNFSWDWRPSTGGPAAFSEPEPIAIRDLIGRVDPDLVVWVHQPLNYVSSIGDTPDAYEQAWSAGSGLPVRPDVTQHGGAESWTALVDGRPSMLIEIASWDATQPMVDAQVAGLSALLDVVTAR